MWTKVHVQYGSFILAKSVIWIFWTKPMKCTLINIICALFHHDRSWENESSGGQIGRYIFCQSAVKGHHIKKIYIKKLFTCN